MKRNRWRRIPDRAMGTVAQRSLRLIRRLAIHEVVLLAVVCVAPASALHGQQLEDDCCPLLLVPVGARSSAMGGAITALAGPDAAFRNPAGLGWLAGTSFVLHHSDLTVGDINAFSLFFAPRFGALGLSYQLFDKGTITTTDPTGQPTGELSIRDHLGVLTLGARLSRSMALGFSYKLFQERIDCRGACGGAERATSFHAVDIGYRFAPEGYRALQLGVSAMNVRVGGGGAETGVGSFPARLHVGVAYEVLHLFWSEELVALRLGIDLQDELRDLGSVVPSAGLELDVQQLIFLRAGYTLGEGLASGAAIGIGLRYDRFDIGVSRSFVNTQLEEGEPFQITFGIHF